MKTGKTCSSLKKRNIKVTRKGKVMAPSANKRHRMLRKNSKMLSQNVGNSNKSPNEQILLKRILGLIS